MTETIDGAEVETESVATQTVYEFFYGLTHGTFVTLDGTEYVYNGTDYDDEGIQIVVLFTATHGSKTTISAADCGQENRWETVKLDNGEPKTSGRLLLRVLRDLQSHRTYTQTYSDQVSELRGEIRSAKRDFDTFNDMLNTFADSGHYGRMCESYEEQLERWNRDLSYFKFVGRPRDWQIQVRILGHEGWIELKERSLEGAIAAVNDLTPQQIIQQLIASGYDFGDAEVEILTSP